MRRVMGGFLIVAVMALVTGCGSPVPTDWNSESAKPNFMTGCHTEGGATKSYCECVFAKMSKTVEWSTYTEFDSAQAEAKSDKDIPPIPSGIKAAMTGCKNTEEAGDTTTTDKSGESSDKTTTTEATTTTKG